MPPLEDCSNEENDNIEYVHHETNLVVLHALNLNVKEEGLEQRENIFHTRCQIGENSTT